MGTETKNIRLVYVETADEMPVGNALEAVSATARLSAEDGSTVRAVMIGATKESAVSSVICAGADAVYLLEQDDLQITAIAERLCLEIASEMNLGEQIRSIYLAGTAAGKAIAPMVAKRFRAGCVTDVVGVTADGVYTTLSYNGNLLNDLRMDEECLQVATIRSGAFERITETSRTGEILKVDRVDLSVPTKVREVVREIEEQVNLEEADIIVTGGRGMGNKEQFQLVAELAEALGGVVGATRPAIEENWVPKTHQVGQSGKIVSPSLYIACGVSGATQHLSGMTGSKYIVAINKDEEAPIFEVADIGIVGDVTKILPLLIEAVKTRG